MKRLLWIDISKGLAILFVAYFHFFTTYFQHGVLPPPDWTNFAASALTILRLAWLKISGLGFHAVGVFIILSGWTLMQSTARRANAGGIAWAAWYRARFLRLYPMYWVAHLVYLVSPFVARLEPVDDRIILSLLGLRFIDIQMNFMYLNAAWWYFSMLIQFYLIFPLLFWTAGRCGPWLFLLIGCAAGFFARYVLLVLWPQNGFWVLGGFAICRLPEFALGMSLAMWYTQSPAGLEWFLLRGAGFVVGLILYPAALQLYHGLYDYIFVDFATGACCMLEIVGIAGFISLFNSPAKLFGLIGLYSYGLYLTHQPYVIWLGLRIREVPIWAFLLICIPTLAVLSAWGMLLEKRTNALVNKLAPLHHGAATESADPDSECRPLSDPVQAWSTFLYASARLLFGLAILSYSISNYRRGDGLIGTLLVIAVLGPVWWTLTNAMLYPFIAQRGWDKAVLLRSFRRDDLSRHDREIIHAALPPRLRLVGVRDPKLRTPFWPRLILEPWAAFRYLGSDRFELEAADRNWLARLQCTLAHSRFAIMDLRDATTNVANEIRLCWKMGNAERNVFITDESKTQAEWVAAVSVLTSVAAEDLEHATFFALPRLLSSLQNKRDATARLRSRFAAIPPGLMPVTGDALTFVQSQVKPADWRTTWFETPAACISVSAILTTVVLCISASTLHEMANAIIQSAVTAIGVILSAVVAARMCIVAFRQRRLGRQRGISLGRSILALLLTLTVGYLQTVILLVLGKSL